MQKPTGAGYLMPDGLRKNSFLPVSRDQDSVSRANSKKQFGFQKPLINFKIFLYENL
jgi:hypothetical protein